MKEEKVGFENWWNVYGLGELCKLEGAILQNWKYGEFDNSIPYGFGCESGFNETDVLIKVAIDRKRKIIYCDQKIYNVGKSEEKLRLSIARHAVKSDLIVADCKDARMINKLKKYFNINPVNNEECKVSEALKIMQDYEIIITDKSYDLAKELNNYIWYDKKAGVPLGGFNHAIDAIRYLFQYLLNNKRTELSKPKILFGNKGQAYLTSA